MGASDLAGAGVGRLYALGNWQFVSLLLASIASNYLIGLLLIAKKRHSRLRLAVLATGIGGDLLMLGIFKYAGFFAANFNALFPSALAVNTLLPVGISFYTFTQVAFLVDAYRGKVAHYTLPHYALFVSYFPHLIAGPILHRRDMIPQFDRAESKRPDVYLILCGLIIFAIGLFKKTCLADGVQPLVALAFGPTPPSFDQVWIAAPAYTSQLYFDFSGYSDMAIGISLMFGISLPLNFNSPYKATSIIDFWRRWYMTLVAVPARLSLYPAQRQRPWTDAPLCQPHDHDGARRPLARRGLEFRRLGHAAWQLSLHQSRLEPLRPDGGAAVRGCGQPRRAGADLRLGRRRLGILSRRHHGGGADDSLENGQSHPNRVRARRNGRHPVHINLCRHRVVRPEYADRDALRPRP